MSAAGELMQPGPDALDALARLLTPPAWHRHAACRGMGPETFFPERGESLGPARAICDGCPVAVQCELEARRSNSEGIWAGTSARGRRRCSTAA